MRKSLMALEDITEDKTGLPPVSITEIQTPEQIVQNGILETDNAIQDSKELTTVINQGQDTASVISNITTELAKATTDEANGITPNEASILNTAVEHLKKSIGYTNTRKMPAMESFGGSMSKKQATVVAMEELQALNEEISVNLKKSFTMEFEYIVTTLTKAVEAKQSLLSKVNTVKANCLEFFKTSSYKPEFNGNELPSSSYVINIFNSKEAMDGKMPSSAVISALNTFRVSLSTDSLIDKVQLLKGAVLACVNDTDLTTDKLKEHFNKVVDIYNSIVTGKAYTSGDTLYKHVLYPISGMKLEISQTSTNESNTNNYWWAGCTNTRELVEVDKCKLTALSDQETQAILDTVEQMSNSKTFSDEVGFVIDLLIKYLEKTDSIEKTIRLTDSNLAYKFYDEANKFRNAARECLHLFNQIFRNELLINVALVDYCQDSVSYHSSRQVA